MSSSPHQATTNKRASFFSHLTGPSGLPSSPRPQNGPASQYRSTSPRSPAAGWQPPTNPASLQPNSRPGPPSPSYSVKTQASSRTTSSTLSQESRVSYVPMSYEPGSYTPVSSIPGPQVVIEKEVKGRGSASRLGSMFSRFKGGKKKGRKVKEEEVEEIQAHNDYMDEDY
ncbi:hypothetical protein EG327_003492 [Venturia inaequalis]|uniref:Uncharacterized protein n=1 Tax=Venturia inaequalis TaxID=5025 RepID=A0A8H3Z9H1_VENIN|nr:hypothetical protein EG327_003492 [Venturia inaequalis]